MTSEQICEGCGRAVGLIQEEPSPDTEPMPDTLPAHVLEASSTRYVRPGDVGRGLEFEVDDSDLWYGWDANDAARVDALVDEDCDRSAAE